MAVQGNSILTEEMTPAETQAQECSALLLDDQEANGAGVRAIRGELQWRGGMKWGKDLP